MNGTSNHQHDIAVATGNKDTIDDDGSGSTVPPLPLPLPLPPPPPSTQLLQPTTMVGTSTGDNSNNRKRDTHSITQHFHRPSTIGIPSTVKQKTSSLQFTVSSWTTPSPLFNNINRRQVTWTTPRIFSGDRAHLQQCETTTTTPAAKEKTTSSFTTNTGGHSRLHPPLQRHTLYSSSSSSSVRGVRNYGQTCFLNAILQSLAPSDIFLMDLHRRVVMQQQQQLQRFNKVVPIHKYNNSTTTNTNKLETSVSVSALLLTILQQLNGQTGTIDTPTLLRKVAEKHEQFRAQRGSVRIINTREQQDAEEFLQALLETIVEGDRTHFCSLPCLVPFTNVLSMTKNLIGTFNHDQDNHSCEDDEVITLASSTQETRTKHKALGATQTPCTSAPVGHPRSSIYYDIPDRITKPNEISEQNVEKLNLQHEEKKQDEASVEPLPRQYLNNHMRYNGDSQPAMPLRSQGDTGQTDCNSDVSSKAQNLSEAMQTMMGSRPHVAAPSPLLCWLGSALQCRNCKHVRPIQNSPFFDIPVIPTAVSRFFYAASCSSGWGSPPIKSNSYHSPDPCTLEECLAEFTSVERVRDVECRRCTLNKIMAELTEDVALYKAALRTTETRTQSDHTRHLRLELERSELKLRAVARASLGSDDETLVSILNYDSLCTRDDGTNVLPPMERHDSYKCLLLTRLPAVLAIHIQRRYYDPVRNRMTKTMQHVHFPEILDMSPYCAYGWSIPGCAWTRPPSFEPGQEIGSRRAKISANYRLLSVIEHRGDAFSGHYVCYRRLESSSDRWFFTSDTIVKEVEWNDVRRCQAYMILYEAI